MSINKGAKYLPALRSEEKEEFQKAFREAVRKTTDENIRKMRAVPGRAKAMEYFDEMSDFFGRREKEIRDFKAKGGKVVGFTCMFAPIELILAAGAIPLRIESGFYTPSKLGDMIVAVEVCPVVRSLIGVAMADLYPYLELCDVIISPNSCDGKTKVCEILSDRFPIWEMSVPRIKDTPQAKRYWLDQVKEIKDKLEKLTGKSITAKAMRSAIATVLKATAASHRLQDLRKGAPVISGRDAMLVDQMSYVDDIVRWTEQTCRLCDELEKKTQEKSFIASENTPRLLLAGSPMFWPDCWKIPNLIEEAKPAGLIVTDEFCSAGRIFSDPVGVDEATKDDMLAAIAQRYVLPCTCPCYTSEDGNRNRIDKIQTMIKDYRIDGIIYHVIRGCHLYAMEYMRLKRLCDREKIPIYYLDTEYSREDSGQMKNRIDAFIEMLATKSQTDDLY